MSGETMTYGMRRISLAESVSLSTQCWQGVAWVTKHESLLTTARCMLSRYRYARARGASRVDAWRYARVTMLNPSR